MTTPALLLVDDQPRNLVALGAILEPLGHELVEARSGREALRILLERDDFAVIVLDVQMPGLDGYQVAEVIKQRERTRTIPIMFLTARSKDELQVVRGYEAGAVDYLFRPFDPEILRAKVSIFVELWEKNRQIREQAERLAVQEVESLRRESAERYRQLADAMPQIVWTADVEGAATYSNRRWFELTGTSAEEADAHAWLGLVHPADRASVATRRHQTLGSGEVFEAEYRLRAADGSYRWHLGREVPVRGDDGGIDFWIGTATDIDDRKRSEQAQLFLLDASAELSRSLDWRAGLRAVAALAVPRAADWCIVDVCEPDGTTTTLAAEHADTRKAVLVRELRDRYPAALESPRGIATVVRTQEAELLTLGSDEAVADMAIDEVHAALLDELGLSSRVCAPIVMRGRVLGVISLVTADSGRRLGELDLRTVQELTTRVAAVAENAELYEEVERRARAARALDTIADGVVLLDARERVLLWNNAAEAITGIPPAAVIGRPAPDVLPGYADSVVAVTFDGRPQTVPVEIDGRELWLSFSAVRSEGGTVYTFRDLTQERRIEQMRSDMVAIVSHELRTPLAALYGAALTLRRHDLRLGAETHVKLLDIIAAESERLTRIVDHVLLANQLSVGQLHPKLAEVDAAEVTEQTVAAARASLPPGVTLTCETAADLPPVAADEQQLRQVLANLLDNAVKYSPDGGPVSVHVRADGPSVRWSVADEGLGVPQSERLRIFEKFYRLDPNMTLGVGGTGLGLYICRELVHRLGGRIWTEPNDVRGSKFLVELPRVPARSSSRRKLPASTVSSSNAD